jgi:ribosome-binding protein aMBF1 (putative translation factor)
MEELAQQLEINHSTLNQLESAQAMDSGISQ